MDCPWCKHTFAPTVYDDVNKLDIKKKKGIDPKANHGKEGRLQPIAAKILMTVLYAARDARLDLLRPICHLACYITRWTSDCDRKLHRLMCYIHSTYHVRMIGWVGDKPEDVQPLFVRRRGLRWMHGDSAVHDWLLSGHSRPANLFPDHRGQ